MIISRFCLTLTLLCCLAACQSTTPRPEPKTAGSTGLQEGKDKQIQTADAREMDEIICKTDPPVGSRIGTRVCMSRRQWIDLQNQSRKMLEDANRNAASSPIPRASGKGGK